MLLLLSVRMATIEIVEASELLLITKDDYTAIIADMKTKEKAEKIALIRSRCFDMGTILCMVRRYFSNNQSYTAIVSETFLHERLKRWLLTWSRKPSSSTNCCIRATRRRRIS